MFKETRKDASTKLEARVADVGDKIQIQVGERPVNVACSVQSVGVYFNTPLTMKRQVNIMYNAC